MILHYLWKYKSIWINEISPKWEISQNLGSKYHFHFDPWENRLSVIERDDIPENFFGTCKAKEESLIANVSCIVGENGVGKTTFLNMIRSVFDGNSAKELVRYLWIIEILVGVTDLPRGFYFGGENVPIREENKPDWVRPLTTEQFYQCIKPNWSMVFYSNIFDFGQLPFRRGLHNISTNYLLRKAPEIIRNDSHPTSMRETTAFKVLELEQNMALIFSNECPDLPFALPKVLKIGVLDENIQRIWEEGIDSGFFKRLIEEYKETNQQFANNPQERYVLELNLAALCTYLVDNSLLGGVPTINVQIETEWNELTSMQKIKRYFQLLAEQGSDDEKEPLRLFRDFLTLFESIVRDRLPDNFPGYRSWNVDIELDGDRNISQSLFAAYKQAIMKTGFLLFDWKGLSSGEQSMLTMFSRFYSLKTPRPSNTVLGKYVLVLIDEGTEYFHPEWQRRFLKYLLDFLPFVYGADKVIQIIIATNSPFVLSDIPRGNVIVLGKKEQIKELGLTFGANIHTLLAHGMFLESTIGEFAEEKIQEIINLLVKVKMSVLERETAQRLIRLIGEPLIRNELQRMLDSKRLEDLDELADLKERIRRLEHPEINEGGV